MATARRARRALRRGPSCVVRAFAPRSIARPRIASQLVSDYTPGWRLSELLDESSAANIPVDITVVIALLRQLLPAVALYGRHNRDAAIGTLAVERLIVTPQARLVIAEHAFGPALEKLNLGRDRLWRELRVAMPPSAGLPRANQRADANAIGVVALSLLLGRVLADDEFPVQQALVEGVEEYRDGQASPLSSSFANWLSRALQFDVRTAFQAPSEAQLAFESVLASDRSYVTSTAKFEEWVSTVGGPIERESVRPSRRPTPRPPRGPTGARSPAESSNASSGTRAGAPAGSGRASGNASRSWRASATRAATCGQNWSAARTGSVSARLEVEPSCANRSAEREQATRA